MRLGEPGAEPPAARSGVTGQAGAVFDLSPPTADLDGWIDGLGSHRQVLR
jgi:hypothetical protein